LPLASAREDMQVRDTSRTIAMLANKAVNLLEKEIEDIVGEELIHTKDFIRK
jgi:hypothetical protein